MKTLFPPTKVCKTCFEDIDDCSISELINPDLSLCINCFEKLNPKFHTFKIGKINCTAIYDYDEDIKGLIYQFKGCYDYELKDIFLERYKKELEFYYHDYLIIPIPSSREDDLRRGFNHVEESFKVLNLKIDRRIYKKIKMKQSDRNAKDRGNIGDFLDLSDTSSLKHKKILLVDDIFTTGSTMRACIELIKQLHPKKIEVLVLCKTRDINDIRKSNYNKLY